MKTVTFCCPQTSSYNHDQHSTKTFYHIQGCTSSTFRWVGGESLVFDAAAIASARTCRFARVVSSVSCQSLKVFIFARHSKPDAHSLAAGSCVRQRRPRVERKIEE